MKPFDREGALQAFQEKLSNGIIQSEKYKLASWKPLRDLRKQIIVLGQVLKTRLAGEKNSSAFVQTKTAAFLAQQWARNHWLWIADSNTRQANKTLRVVILPIIGFHRFAG